MPRRRAPQKAHPAPRPRPVGVERDRLAAVAEAVVWLLVLAVPLLVVPSARDAFRLPKLLVAGWLGLASLVPLAFRLRRSPRLSWRDLATLPALAAVVPLLVLGTLSLVTSSHPEHVRQALPDLWIGAAVLVGWSLGLGRRRLRRLLSGLEIPAALLALLVVLQYHGLFQPFTFSAGAGTSRLQLTSLAGNVGDLADFLVLPALLAQLDLRRRKGWARGLAAAVLALSAYALFIAQTLAAMVAFVVASAVIWALLLPRRRALPVLAGGAVAAAALVLAVAPLRARLEAKAGELGRGEINRLLSGRLDGWRTAGQMLIDHPLAGVGQGAFEAAFGATKLELLDRGVPFLVAQPNPTFANAHNEVLEVGADLGIPGLLALAWGLWIVFTAARRAPEAGRPLAWGGLSALAILSLGHFPFRVALTGYPALLLLAWVLTPERGEVGG